MLLTLKDLSFGFGHPPLLDRISLAVDAGERLAVVGRNGAGKSTLLDIIRGVQRPDSGEILRAQGSRIGHLSQTVPAGLGGTVFEVIAAGLGPIGEAASACRALAALTERSAGETRRLEEAEATLERLGGWGADRTIETVATRLALDPGASVESLSAGTRRRVLLARALIESPDLLLLDEPTNHLDLPSIEWLEERLSSYEGAILFITHDRRFLDAVATAIVEIDRGRLARYPGDWKTYVSRRDEALRVEDERSLQEDRKLAEEELWIRRGVKARRKRNMGRVRELEALRAERRARRERSGSVRMAAGDAGPTGQLVIAAKGISYSWGDRPILRDFTATIHRGDRVGIIGPNGSGKTTLLRLLLGQLSPSDGTVRHGTNLQIAYFDQLQESLDEAKSLRDNITGGHDMVDIGGRPRHVVGYLQEFLFTPAQANGPARGLSGGERNRLLLARLLARPSNVLVLDEPTNDLDIETLDLLVELIHDYPGTVLAVSHDRQFLDDIATSTLVFEGDGAVGEYVGGYSDWARQQRPPAAPPPRPAPKAAARRPGAIDEPRRLTFKERQELERLPGSIEELEGEKAGIHEAMGRPEFFRGGDPASIAAAVKRLGEIDEALAAAYARWQELDERDR